MSSSTQDKSKAGFPALRLANAVGWTLDTIAVVIALSSLVFMFLALMADVIVRYMTTRGLGWPTEVPNLLFPWLIMGGIVIGAHRGAHIAATALIDYLSVANARILGMALQVMVCGVFIALAWISLKVIAVTGHQVFPLTGIPQFWAYAAVTFGCFGIALSALVNLVRVFYADDPRFPLSKTSVEHQL
ncbi:TRAP transporter small permease [Oceaniovalibus sp. ACAM 378]|jgi:TRAP-type C4-dicarboxylate transport system permease small subunit|uniref:TRAP transporter small permease protein n=1 Tax=Vreelandella neptunia TaxID=115551 RepID=A0ABS9SCF3_9GAMM|nr:TRAP transporter small permease [Oceaniovalibus sp. ACAM 378]MCH4813770.1 TRAP transporter small permease [Halomonas neptunia]TYB84037.1 TRAP transporter small permease [Oceaniovalibus sp. ACAM 378]